MSSDDVTRLAADAKPSSAYETASPGHVSSSGATSGWLANSSIDHRRFTPGPLLGARRIVEKLGKGGMGEVFSAD